MKLFNLPDILLIGLSAVAVTLLYPKAVAAAGAPTLAA